MSAGGVEPSQGDVLLHDQIYYGNGQGRFGESESLADGTSTTALAVTRNHGETLLFVGGRSIPGEWPKAAPSFLYSSSPDGLVANPLTAALNMASMVTSASWSDLDSDGDPDLIVATEWGPVRIFHNDSGEFTERTAELGLSDHTGWWSAVEVTDVNHDGLIDIIAGNVGLNTKYRASAEFPAVLFAGDLDSSNRFEILEAQYDKNEQLYPVRGLSKLSYSFRRLRRKYRSFERFAEATVSDLFSPEKLNQALHLEATELRSGVFEQQVDGQFVFTPLPIEAQMAPIHRIGWADFDGDSHQDLVVVGNDFSPEPSTGRFDGSLGRILTGDSHGNFTALSPAVSGLITTGDTRGMTLLFDSSGVRIVTADAKGPVRLFETSSSAKP